MTWLHEISLSALAAAVLTLGAVMLLELRSMARLRQVVDGNLARVFEQLDLLRFESQQLLEAQGQAQAGLRAVTGIVTGPSSAAARAEVPAVAPTQVVAAAPPPPAQPHSANAYQSAAAFQGAAALAATGVQAQEIAHRFGLATGEARLLSSLAQARARRAEAAETAESPRAA